MKSVAVLVAFEFIASAAQQELDESGMLQMRRHKQVVTRATPDESHGHSTNLDEKGVDSQPSPAAETEADALIQESSNPFLYKWCKDGGQYYQEADGVTTCSKEEIYDEAECKEAVLPGSLIDPCENIFWKVREKLCGNLKAEYPNGCIVLARGEKFLNEDGFLEMTFTDPGMVQPSDCNCQSQVDRCIGKNIPTASCSQSDWYNRNCGGYTTCEPWTLAPILNEQNTPWAPGDGVEIGTDCSEASREPDMAECEKAANWFHLRWRGEKRSNRPTGCAYAYSYYWRANFVFYNVNDDDDQSIANWASTMSGVCKWFAQ